MKKIAIILMLVTIISKILGFFRDITLSYFYGASNISDAYIISLSIPMTIFGFIGAGITTVYMPLYSKIELNEGKSNSNKFTNNLINILVLLSTIIIVLIIIFTETLVKIFASGFNGHTFVMAVNFTRICSISICITAIIYIYTGYLQLKNNYIIAALVGIPFNIFLILSIYFSYKQNIAEILSIGYVVAVISQFVLLVPFVRKNGLQYDFIFNLKDENIKKFIKLSIPTMIGVSVYQVDSIIDKALASTIVDGGVSALNYAYKLIFFVFGIIVLSISTMLYPLLSKMAAENNMNGLKKAISEAISGINLIVIPVTIGAMVFSEPVVKILFERGEFDSQATKMTSDALFYYSIGMVGFGLREVLSKAFYSLQDTKTPMRNAIIAIISNIILNIFLSKYMGINGLAFATSISGVFCSLLLLISLRRKIGLLGLRIKLVSFVKILVASSIAGGFSKLSLNILSRFSGSFTSLILAIGLGGGGYLILIYFMRVNEFNALVNVIMRYIKNSFEGMRNNK